MREGSTPEPDEQVAHQDAVLVRRLLAARGEPPVAPQLRALVDAEHGVGVAGVDRQQQAHGASGRKERGVAGKDAEHASRRILDEQGASLVDVERQPADPVPRDLDFDRAPEPARRAVSPARQDRRRSVASERMIPDAQAGQDRRRRLDGVAAFRSLGRERRRLAAEPRGRLGRRSRRSPPPRSRGPRRRSSPRRGCRRACARAPARRWAISVRGHAQPGQRLAYRDSRRKRKHAPGLRRSEGLSRTERWRLPAGDAQARPWRPLPAVCRSARSTLHSAAPARARSFSSSFVDSATLRCSMGAGHAMPPSRSSRSRRCGTPRTAPPAAGRRRTQRGSISSEMSTAGAECVSAPIAM